MSHLADAPAPATGQVMASTPPGPRGEPDHAADSSRLAHRSRAQTKVRWELLRNLVRKDLKVKYKGSTLGFAWSLANPMLLLVVYTFVFQIVLKAGIPRFGIYLMSGLLIWNAFSGSVSAACGSVVANANLVKKVRFPLAVLPLSAVGFAAVHFLLQLAVLFVVILVLGYHLLGPNLLLLVPAGAVAFVFTVALSLLVSALNVRYRDTAHLLDVALLAWFWVNPMVYAFSLIEDRLHEWTWVYLLNPMAVVVISFQRAIYAPPAGYSTGHKAVLPHDGYRFYLEHLAIAGATSLALLWIGLQVFRTMQADFAEDL
ncbi:ABC transporter permease [Frankia sp. R82]|uniref:ABC transporter permease n=1 Tax=Frankia sp. R82 TaxID=2950553 RepID=UPI002044B659|nr:ABC transporter permease [Frankia sp. R82]MCM3887351.1 ABC transporter permease [Frankia sp. R82]